MSNNEGRGNRRFSGSGDNKRGRMSGRGFETYRRGGGGVYNKYSDFPERRKSSLEFGVGQTGILGTAKGHRGPAVLDIYGIIDEYTALEAGSRKNSLQSRSSTPTVDLSDTFLGENHQLQSLVNTTENLALDDTKEMKKRADVTSAGNYGSVNYPRNYGYVSLTTGIPRLIFVCARNNDVQKPRVLVEKFFEDFVAKGEAPLECVLRLIPIDITCKANFDDIVLNLRKILLDRIPGKGYISFSVEFIDSNNSSFEHRFYQSRGELVAFLQGTVTAINPDAYISLNNPQYLVFVQLIGGVACLSILSNFAKYRHYSVAEFKKEKVPLKPEKDYGDSDDEEK